MVKTISKRLLFLFAVGAFLMAGTIQSKAQSAVFGFRLMPTFSKMEMKTSTGESTPGTVNLGFGTGAFLGFYWSDNVGIQGELMYTTVSQKYREADVERRVTLQYVNIPLLLSLNTGKSNLVNFNLVLGPQIGINVGAKVSSSGLDTTNAMLSIRAGDLGLAYGAGIDYGINEARTFRVGIGYRGVNGLINISNNSQNPATNSFYIIDRTNLKTHAGYIGISYMF